MEIFMGRAYIGLSVGMPVNLFGDESFGC